MPQFQETAFYLYIAQCSVFLYMLHIIITRGFRDNEFAGKEGQLSELQPQGHIAQCHIQSR